MFTNFIARVIQIANMSYKPNPITIHYVKNFTSTGNILYCKSYSQMFIFVTDKANDLANTVQHDRIFQKVFLKVIFTNDHNLIVAVSYHE